MKRILTLAVCVLFAGVMTIPAWAGEAAIQKLSTDYTPKSGQEIENGIDGDLSTRTTVYIASDAGHDILVELDQMSYVSGISVAWYKGTKRSNDVEVYVSADGNTWVTSAVRCGTDMVETDKDFADLFFDKSYEAKYLKLRVFGNTTDGVYAGAADKAAISFWEMKVLTDDNPPAAVTTAPETTAAVTTVPVTTAPEITAAVTAAPTLAEPVVPASPATVDSAVLLSVATAVSTAAAVIFRKNKA